MHLPIPYDISDDIRRRVEDGEILTLFTHAPLWVQLWNNTSFVFYGMLRKNMAQLTSARSDIYAL